jgi:hypothetical protein
VTHVRLIPEGEGVSVDDEPCVHHLVAHVDVPKEPVVLVALLHVLDEQHASALEQRLGGGGSLFAEALHGRSGLDRLRRVNSEETNVVDLPEPDAGRRTLPERRDPDSDGVAVDDAKDARPLVPGRLLSPCRRGLNRQIDPGEHPVTKRVATRSHARSFFIPAHAKDGA